MTPEEASAHFLQQPRAILGTADAEGVPHLVPVVFAAVGGELKLVIDYKPKRTTQLKRLRNIAVNPRVSLLTDHYADDWTRLWWARADGIASVEALTDEVVRAFQAKYPQYRLRAPEGPAVTVAVAKWSGWAFTEA